MKKSVVIPSAIQVCSDDVGWFIGADQRYCGKPSRSGMTRKHCPEDYLAINEIGKAIGQKIMCPLVIGEWDRDNILRDEPGTTFEPGTWDRASLIDYKLAEQCFEAAESSEYLEYALHGVLHGNYGPKGEQITEMEYLSYDEKTDKFYFQTEEEINHRISLFKRIFDTWGFKKKIRSFAAPNGISEYLTSEDAHPLAEALKKNGIEYWANSWKKEIGHTEFIDGILYMEKGTRQKLPWNAYDIDPRYISDFAYPEDETIGIISGNHWPNFLRFNKENTFENVKYWKEYFDRQAEIFGVMISKDIAFAGNQCVYRAYSKAEIADGKVRIDVSDTLAKSGKYASGEFYVSLEKGIVPKEAKGGKFELYEEHKEFDTYKIAHTDRVIELEI